MCERSPVYENDAQISIGDTPSFSLFSSIYPTNTSLSIFHPPSLLSLLNYNNNNNNNLNKRNNEKNLKIILNIIFNYANNTKENFQYYINNNNNNLKNNITFLLTENTKITAYYQYILTRNGEEKEMESERIFREYFIRNKIDDPKFEPDFHLPLNGINFINAIFIYSSLNDSKIFFSLDDTPIDPSSSFLF